MPKCESCLWVHDLINNANSKSLKVLVLGHDSNDTIFMPYDIRTALGVDKGGKLDFSFRKVGVIGRLCWLVNSPDPAVYLPAWIAVFGLILAVVGIVIGILPLLCS